MSGTNSLSILERLVAFASVSAESNLPIIDHISGFLAERGFALRRVTDPGGNKAGLIARIGPADGAGIMLSGHTDVVPTAGQSWTSDPFQLRHGGDRVFGRGTADMKGFLAAMLSLADRARSAPLQEPLTLVFSWDEELGCLGIPHMLPALKELLPAPRLCIVGEPTEMQIALGHKGKIALGASCSGMAGHSAMAPDFVNAIHLATDLVAGIRQLQEKIARDGARDEAYDIPYATLHVGKIAGGRALNIVPDLATLDFECRYPACQELEPILADIRALAASVAATYQRKSADIRVDLGTLFAYPGLGVAPDRPEVRLLQQFVPGAAHIKVAYGTEAGYFDQIGIPTLVCGPGSMEQGHKPDEFITLSELARCDAMCDRILAYLSVAA